MYTPACVHSSAYVNMMHAIVPAHEPESEARAVATGAAKRFWATVYKTVRRMLSDRCLSCLSVLSVTLVYCGQTVGWIKMKLGVQVGLGSGHIVLHGNPAPPPQRGTAPNFRSISV